MSQTIYLAELLPCFRSRDELTRGHSLHLRMGATVFHNRRQAFDWAKKTMPIAFNPFVGLSITYSFGNKPYFLLWLNDEVERAIPLYEFREQLYILGLTSPQYNADFIREQVHVDWWNATAPGMTDDQKAAI